MTNYITKTIKNGVEANIPVTSVNWQYGDVTIQTGGSYTAWNWIDITNDEIWLDGTYEWTDYSAMQWPAPSGFHVPSKDEWVALWGILTTTFSMAQNNTTIETYLKMPMAGYRLYRNSNVSTVGTIGQYWSSTPYSADRACMFYFSSPYSWPQYENYRSYGYSVRCFKNSPVIPTSSWTTLYDWSSVASWAWVFYNTTDGLISVSGDWQTWYTIMDKNLWATTVFNQWDTVNDANSGYFYQWWNNYWFAHSWTVTTSSTQVDASNYWPWNYYSSSTFIARSEKTYDWSSVQNDDLWGGVTWQTVSWNLVVWDKLYKIVISTTAPASWTASNIITISTGSTKWLYVWTTKIA